MTPIGEHLMVLATSGSWGVQKLDSAGIPRQFYSRLGASYYNPVYVSMVGLRDWQSLVHDNRFDYFLRNYQTLAPAASDDSIGRRAHFLAIANWLVSHRVERQSHGQTFAVWEYGFPWPIYHLQAPWISGMAQGVAIQVLVRAWRLTEDTTYRSVAIDASHAFEVEVCDGGVTYKDSPGEWWYEEYAAPGANQSRVLNGMEHAILGLQDLLVIGDYPQAAPLVERGLRSLKKSIDRFDLGWWTSYDLVGTIANRKYQFVNVGLTESIGRQTGSPALLRAAAHWSTYSTPFFEREFLRQRPNYIDVVVLGLNASVVWLAGLVAFLLMRLSQRRAASGLP